MYISKYKLCLTDYLLFLLIQMMLLAQTGYMSIKIAIIILICIFNQTKRLYRFKYYNGLIFRILGFILFCGFYRISSAILMGTMETDVLLRHFSFLIINPLLYYLLIPNIKGDAGAEKVCFFLLIGHFFLIFIGLYNLFAVFVGLHPIILMDDDIFIVSEESISFSSSGTYQMFLTLPVFFTLGFSKFINSKLFLFGGILSAVYVVLCGSAAMIIVGLGCLLIPLALKYFYLLNINKPFNIKKDIFIILIIGSLGYLGFSEKPFMEVAYQDFIYHFDKDYDIRFEQRKLLLDAWMESPVWGKGYGAYFVTSRGRERGFESMYHATLATTGLVGLVLYLLPVYIIIVNLYRKSQKDESPFEAALLFGYISMLICSITNPALASFDRLLVIYLCIGCLAEKKSVKYHANQIC